MGDTQTRYDWHLTKIGGGSAPTVMYLKTMRAANNFSDWTSNRAEARVFGMRKFAEDAKGRLMERSGYGDADLMILADDQDAFIEGGILWKRHRDLDSTVSQLKKRRTNVEEVDDLLDSLGNAAMALETAKATLQSGKSLDKHDHALAMATRAYIKRFRKISEAVVKEFVEHRSRKIPND